jgi:hypothetical protein
MSNNYRAFPATFLICALLSVAFAPSLYADEKSHYTIARDCVEYSLSSEDFFAFFDALTADSIKEQLVDNVRFRGYEKVTTEIHQQATREFLVKDKALESTWDKAARKLMLEFLETELLSVRDYQTRKTGKEFLETAAGKKWHEKAETIVRAAFEDVRHSVFEGSKYETYRHTVEEKIAQAEARGKLPAGLIRSGAPPTELKPVDSQDPIFRIFEAVLKNEEKPAYAINDTKPLLAVSTLSDLIIARDGKGILIRLNESDTKAFAELTRKFQGQVLFVQCTGTLFEGMRITAPIEDGYIGWRHPRSAEVAEYLRKRFRIGEFK